MKVEPWMLLLLPHIMLCMIDMAPLSLQKNRRDVFKEA